jgi:hypothetical protein
MDCLKCGNYWTTDVDELMCEFCPYTKEFQEKEKKDEG